MSGSDVDFFELTAVDLARQGCTLNEIHERTGLSLGDVTAQLVQAGIVPDSPAHKLRAYDALLQRGIGMTVKNEALAGGEIVELTKQLPPDTAALSQYLQATLPERFRDERPAMAVQYVVNLPTVSADAQTWLRDIGRDSRGQVIRGELCRPDGQAVNGQAVESGPGRLVPTVSGPVPDPVAVPPVGVHSESAISGKNKKNRLD